MTKKLKQKYFSTQANMTKYVIPLPILFIIKFRSFDQALISTKQWPNASTHIYKGAIIKTKYI